MRNILSFVFVFIITIGVSQTKKDALRDAKIVATATLKSDFKTVLKHTYPSIIKLMGNEEKAVKIIKQTFTQMKEQGFIFEKADVISVSEIINEQGQYRCYIEGFNQIKMPKTRIKSKSYLLGIYDENGKKWWFLEAEKIKNKALLNQILPNFKTSLKIPKDEITMEKL